MRKAMTLAEAVAEGRRRGEVRRVLDARRATEAAATLTAQQEADAHRGRLLKAMQAWIRTHVMDLVAAAVGQDEAHVMLDDPTFSFTPQPPLPLDDPAAIALLLHEGLVVEHVSDGVVLAGQPFGPAWRLTWPGVEP